MMLDRTSVVSTLSDVQVAGVARAAHLLAADHLTEFIEGDNVTDFNSFVYYDQILAEAVAQLQHRDRMRSGRNYGRTDYSQDKGDA
jgi:GTP cyclohydrolase III